MYFQAVQLILSFYGVRGVLKLASISIEAGPLIPSALSQTEPYFYRVYDKQKLNDEFNIKSFAKLSCIPNNLTYFKAYTYDPYLDQQQSFRLFFTIEGDSNQKFHVNDISTKNYYDHQNLETAVEYSDTKKVMESNKDNKFFFSIMHKCQGLLTNENYWSIISVTTTFMEFKPITFQYQFICDINYHPYRFDGSNLILILIASLSIYLLARFGKLYSVKILFRKTPRKMKKMITGVVGQDEHLFQGFFLSWSHAVLYILLMGTALTLSLIYKSAIEYYEELGVLIFSCFTTFHFFDECLCQFEDLKRKVCWKVKIRHLFTLVISSIIIFVYIYWEKPWFISDVISICIMGSMVKVYKIISMRDSVYFLAPCFIADLIAFTYVVIYVRYEWDSVAMRYFNTPLFFQLPYFNYIYKKKCCWISIFNILFPGFFIGLTYRFDYSKGTLIYEIISFFWLLVGMICWLIVSSVYSLPLPVALFTEVPMVSLSALYAWKRNEITSLWSGHFYDQILLEPFKNKIIAQGSGRSSVLSLNLFVKNDIELGNMDKGSSSSQENEQTNQQLVKQSRGGRLELHSDLFQGLLAKNDNQ